LVSWHSKTPRLLWLWPRRFPSRTRKTTPARRDCDLGAKRSPSRRCYVEALPDGKLKSDAMRNIIPTWQTRTSTVPWRWSINAAGKARDDAQQSIASQWARTDPQAAMAYGQACLPARRARTSCRISPRKCSTTTQPRGGYAEKTPRRRYEKSDYCQRRGKLGTERHHFRCRLRVSMPSGPGQTSLVNASPIKWPMTIRPRPWIGPISFRTAGKNQAVSNVISKWADSDLAAAAQVSSVDAGRRGPQWSDSIGGG